MKKSDIAIRCRYIAAISDRLVPVEVLAACPVAAPHITGFLATDLQTGDRVTVTADDLQRPAPAPWYECAAMLAAIPDVELAARIAALTDGNPDLTMLEMEEHEVLRGEQRRRAGVPVLPFRRQYRREAENWTGD
jgi:hypothetical protein